MNRSHAVFKKITAIGEVVSKGKLRPLKGSDFAVGVKVVSAGLCFFGNPFVDIPEGLVLTIKRLEKQERWPDPKVFFDVSVDGEIFEFCAPYPSDQLFGIAE